MAMRHALSQYPECRYMWYLDDDALIVEQGRSLEQQVLEPKTMEALMIRDYPVVPPDSIIHTFKFLQAPSVGLVVSQDGDGLVAGSIVVKNGDWARFFTETWLDPLYRTYNFQKAERHALVGSQPFPPIISPRISYFTSNTCLTNLYHHRSTWFSGILPSCPRLHLCRSGHSHRTLTPTWAKGTRRVTLSS